MKYRYFLSVFLVCILSFHKSSFAQLVGDNAFLQGQWLEACIAPNGAWGNTMPVPAGYHHRGGSSLSYTDPITGTTPSGDGLDFSFDQGHDGWGAGTPPFYGAYFLPGTPFDGWSVQLDDTMSSAFYSSGGFDTSLGGIFGGTVTGYSGPTCSNPHGAMAGTWQGTVGLHRAGLRNALQMTIVNEVDTNASWLNVTVKFVNTTDSTLPGIYYMATADPDNDEDIPGTFPTNNHIAYQGGPFDRHEVWARPPSVHQDAFSGLATQDCRAKALIYSSWPPSMSTGNDLDKVWAGTPTGMGSTFYTLGATTYDEDWAYGLVFNVGNLAPHDSNFISFAWIFSDTFAVDSIFTTQPNLVTLGVAHSPGQKDSVFGCNLAGCGVAGKTFTADIVNGSNRNWTYSKWSWSPAIGLSVTTGLHVVCDIGLLSGPTTYTITGTPDATRGSCTPPAPVTFTMFVQPCFSASSNVPCLGDTLFLIGTGDSAGASFFWSGPAGYVNTGESSYRYPTTMADTGTYRLIRIVGSNHDTTYTHVSITPLPVVTATVTPICSGNTLVFTATPAAVGETFAWTGPNGFVSGLQNPTILAAPETDSGLYRVVTTLNGCNDTSYTRAIIDSTPAKPLVGSNSPICSQNGVLLLTSGDKTPGITSYDWSGPLLFTSTLENPVLAGLSTFASGVYTVTATIVYKKPALSCSNFNTVTVSVDSTPIVPVLTSNGPICSGFPLDLTATSSPGTNYAWTGPDGFSSTQQNPIINPAITANTGTYSVTVTSIYPGPLACSSNPVATIYVSVDSTPIIPKGSSNSPGAPGTSICQGDTLKLFATDTTSGVTYLWKGPGGFTSPDQDPEIAHILPAATGLYTVTATLDGACSASVVITVSITPTPPLTATSNSPVCSGDSLMLQALSDPGATYSWSGPYTFSSSLQNPERNPAIMEYGGVYQVVAVVRGCPSLTVNDTVDLRQTPPAPWVKWLTYCQYYRAFPLQAYGDSILWYTSVKPPLMGTLTPPVPPTDQLGTSYYFATQTIMGCISRLDSIQVTVYPTPVLSLNATINVCPHDSAVLKASSSNAIAYYHWTPALYLSDTSSPSVITRPINDVDYTVVVANEFGCKDTGHIAVRVHAGAVLQLPAHSVTIYPGESYQLSPETNCSYFNWFPPYGLDNANISNPVASPSVNTRYTVTGITNNGCTITDSIDILVDAQSILALPNAFRPGSATNGTFKIIKNGIATLNSFNIFDRWGVEVFKTTNIDEGWDGTYKGTPQPFGVYVYEISAVTSAGENFVKKGNVTLVR